MGSSERCARTAVLKGSGKPPGGTPNLPCRYSTTESGYFAVLVAKTACSGEEIAFATKNCAKSPTTLEEGVTFGMSPRTLFAMAYAFFTSPKRPSKPSCLDWNSRFVYCPPGISCSSTSEDVASWPLSKGAYRPVRTSSQYLEISAKAAASKPVSSSVPFTAATIAPKDGCDVSPAMESIAASTTSAPAAAAASMEATPAPALSCVCTWIGTSGNLWRKAETSKVAAFGVNRPAMSLMARPWAP
mmetsp:Transcript_23155/g.78199  ORF Transcript_23155/g.78199 Transcript_23155/m.78199 type:complete len:244 (+) Transcript_23155:1861-2592(+)